MKHSAYPHRFALRLTDRNWEHLKDLRGYHHKWEPSEIVRHAIEELHKQWMIERASGTIPPVAPLDLVEPFDDNGDRVRSDVDPLAPVPERQALVVAELEVKEKLPNAKAKAKRSAKPPKPGDNHRPKKGTSDGRRKDSHGSPGGSKASTGASRPKPASARPRRK